MVIEYIRYTIDAARQDDFAAACTAAFGPLLSSPYCQGADLARCVDASDSFILRIEWTSAEDHMQRFRASEAFRAFLPHVRPFIGDIQEMRHYERLPMPTEPPA